MRREVQRSVAHSAPLSLCSTSALALYEVPGMCFQRSSLFARDLPRPYSRCLFEQATQPGAKEAAEAEAPASGQTADGKAGKAPPGDAAAGAASSGGGLFGAFGKRFYEGGFEDKMTRKEAALILGVRERAPAQRIKVRRCCRVCVCVLSYPMQSS